MPRRSTRNADAPPKRYDTPSGSESEKPKTKSRSKAKAMPKPAAESKKRKQPASSDKDAPSKKAKKSSAVIEAEEKVKELKEEEKEATNELKEAKKATAEAAKQQKQEETAAKKATADVAKEKRQAEVNARKAVKQAEDAVKAENKQWKKNWEDHWQKGVSEETLDEKPEKNINQTDAGTIYRLTPKELGSLRHFPEYVPFPYKTTKKLFDEEEVKELAFRKYAMLAGVSNDDEKVLSRGKELWEEEGASKEE